jgi:hypothetical protein
MTSIGPRIIGEPSTLRPASRDAEVAFLATAVARGVNFRFLSGDRPTGVALLRLPGAARPRLLNADRVSEESDRRWENQLRGGLSGPMLG